MKILKHGNKYQCVKRFLCTSCGCIFEANIEEYEQEFCKDTICPHFNFSCKCPECGYVTKNLI